MRLQTTYGHMAGACAAAFIERDDKAHLITAGADCMAIARRVDPTTRSGELDNDNAEVTGHADGITAVATSPSGDFFATASEDKSVRLYAYPDLAFLGLATRFTLPVRAVAFDPSGTVLAAGGDDGCLRVLSVDPAGACEVACTLDDLPTAVRSLAYDPKGEFLAASLVNGTVLVLDVANDYALAHTLEKAAPAVDVAQHQTNAVAWVAAEGALLAVPDRACGVALYDRLQGFQLAGKLANEPGAGSSEPVGCVAFSPNGRYALLGCRDAQLLLYDLANPAAPQDIDRRTLGAMPAALTWHPSANMAAVIDVDGEYAVWNNVVPAHLASALATYTPAAASYGFTFEGDAPADARSPRDVAADAADDDDADAADAAADADDDADYDRYRGDGGRRHGGGRVRRGVGGGFGYAAAPALPVQDAFQPGCTPSVGGGDAAAAVPRFLAYTMLGSITTRAEATCNSIDVAFHDTSRQGGRMKAMSDYYNFTLAALSEQGAAYASQVADGKPQSTLMYRPFRPWAPNSDWTQHLPEGEEVLALACGSSWVAATTSHHHLRLFSAGGVQSFVMTLEGRPVTVVGQQNLLAVVWVAAPPTGGVVAGVGAAAATQNLCYALWDVSLQQELSRGALPLGPGAMLTWLGFSEEGLLAAADSTGVVRVRVREFGGVWAPVFSSEAARKSQAETHWVVGLTASELYCVVCPECTPYPQVQPRPLLSPLPLCMPLVAGTEATGGAKEEEFVRASLMLAQQQDGSAEAARRSLQRRVDLDRGLLTMFHQACKADLMVRARELAERMSLHKSLQGALKIATATRLPALAERVMVLLQSRAKLTAEPLTPTPAPASAAPPAAAASTLSQLSSQPSQQACSSPLQKSPPASSQAENAPPLSANLALSTPDPSCRDAAAAAEPKATTATFSILKRKLGSGGGGGGGGEEEKAAKKAAPSTLNPTTPSNPFARK